MGALSPWHWAVAVLVVVVLFAGPGRISGALGDLGRGLGAFRNGLRRDPGA